MSTLAIIPARGGSKGIPNKNLTWVGDKRLIDYTIEASQNSKCLNRIILSSDDKTIIEYCTNRGIISPFIRPPELSDDKANMIDVVKHALQWLKENEEYIPNIVVLLQPTSPLRSAGDIDDALSLMQHLNVESLISVNEMLEHPQECICEENGSWFKLLKQKNSSHQRQDYIGNYYFINGAIYAFTPKFLQAHGSLTKPGKQTALYKMPPDRSIDIDTFDDLHRAESYISNSDLRLSLQNPILE